jgi:hypothetical protein
MPKRSKLKKFNWKALPDPISEDEVNIQITWTADARTTAALERQAKKIGHHSVNDYVRFAVIDFLVMDEQDSAITDDGRIVSGWETWETEGEDGFSKER